MNNRYYEGCRVGSGATGISRLVTVGLLLLGYLLAGGIGSAFAATAEGNQAQDQSSILPGGLTTVSLVTDRSELAKSGTIGKEDKEWSPGNKSTVESGAIPAHVSDSISSIPYALILALLALVSLVPVSRR